MKTNRFAKIVKYGVLGIAGITAFGYLMMILWNWLMPPVFGWHSIGFWQALGLFLLFSILFGGGRNQGAGKCPRRSDAASNSPDVEARPSVP